jgi:hypothetical protein
MAARVVAKKTEAFQRINDIGSSLMPDKTLTVAFPIPTRSKQKEEPKPLVEMVNSALAEVGGTDYLVQVAKYDHRTFCALLRATAPRDLNIGPTQSLLEVMRNAAKMPLPPREMVVLEADVDA